MSERRPAPRRPYGRPQVPDLPGPGLGFKIWFAFCLLVALAVLGLMAWGGIALIQYLNRH